MQSRVRKSEKKTVKQGERRGVCPGLSVLSPTIPASKVFPSSSRDKKKERKRERGGKKEVENPAGPGF